LLDLMLQEELSEGAILPQFVELLAAFEPNLLRAEESQFLHLAVAGKHPATRQGALAAIARIDRSDERAATLVGKKKAGEKHNGRIDLLKSLQYIPESETRALFFDRVRAWILAPKATGAPVEVAAEAVDAMVRIPGHESQKIEAMITLVENNRHRANALAVIRAVPQSHWRSSHAERLVATATEHVSQIAPAKRAAAEVADEIRLALEFVEWLPLEDRSEARGALKAFRTQVLRLGSIPHRMAYSREKMVVQAGSSVQLVFKNGDNMPHNFVLTQPGALAEIGQRAESEATQPGMIARDYVPESDKVLLASRLLQPKEQQTLDFRAPKKPGVYPYVCTYPGHWRRMYGALYVVENIKQYKANPASYLAAHAITVQDELLKFNRPLKKWAYEELEPALATLAEGRDFERGKEIFQAASCAACHTVQGDQNRFAPDLTKLDPKRKPQDVLRSMLEPSQVIDEKYQMSQFVLDTGKSAVGLVVEESDQEVMLIVDPLASCAPVVLAKAEIDERYKSTISLMPSGLLDRLTEEEILELCAFVVSRGDSKAPVYRPTESR